MRKLIMCLIGVLSSLVIAAQDNVEGVISDASGKPVKGIKIRLNGLFKTSKTNSKGVFRLKRILEGDTLLIYPTEEQIVRIPIKPDMSLSLQLGDHSLSCRYGTNTVTYMFQQAPKINYSNNIITRRQIIEFAPNNLIELLRGRIAGLQIQEMGGTAKASIRGVSSMSLNTEPLFIIGGTQYETLEAANNAISIEDIMEVEVKKDGSEYGMKGANGVIIIKMR
jgi:hypothetical protein